MSASHIFLQSRIDSGDLRSNSGYGVFMVVTPSALMAGMFSFGVDAEYHDIIHTGICESLELIETSTKESFGKQSLRRVHDGAIMFDVARLWRAWKALFHGSIDHDRRSTRRTYCP